MAHTECSCPAGDGRLYCPTVRRWMTPRLREQCASSQAFRDGFAALPPQAAPGEEPALPSLPRRAANYAKAQARHTANGRKKAPPELKAARLAVCRGTDETPHCEKFRPSDETCSQRRCGCVVEDKAGWLSEACPLGLWPKAEAAT